MKRKARVVQHRSPPGILTKWKKRLRAVRSYRTSGPVAHVMGMHAWAVSPLSLFLGRISVKLCFPEPQTKRKTVMVLFLNSRLRQSLKFKLWVLWRFLLTQAKIITFWVLDRPWEWFYRTKVSPCSSLLFPSVQRIESNVLEYCLCTKMSCEQLKPCADICGHTQPTFPPCWVNCVWERIPFSSGLEVKRIPKPGDLPWIHLTL